MTNTYELTINNTDNTSKVTLTTTYPEEVMRLLQLSGQAAPMPEPQDVQAPAMHMPNCGCDTCAPDAKRREMNRDLSVLFSSKIQRLIEQ